MDETEKEAFHSELEQAMDLSDVAVFYSPSGVDCVFRTIPKLEEAVFERRMVLAAIGQTTKAALLTILGHMRSNESSTRGSEREIVVPTSPDSPNELARVLSNFLCKRSGANSIAIS